MTSTTQAELKPCPFCGADGYIERRESGWIVRCTSRYEKCPINGRTHHCMDRQEAIAAWNTRAPVTTQADVAELIKKLRDYADDVAHYEREGDAAFINQAADTLVALSARLAEAEAENARLRGVIKYWPTRSDYATEKDFLNAHFNWETQQARAALEGKAEQ